MMSNRPGLNALSCSALFGLDHQVTRAEMTPPQTAAASSIQPILTASQRLRVTLCIQANCVVPASASAATSGAPQNSPTRAGAPSVEMTRKPTAWLPRNSPPRCRHPWPAAQAACAAWY